MEASLEISFLGFPTVMRDEQVVGLPERKTLALLAYLAVSGEIYGRDTLATLFWPAHNQRQARANLRYVLWLLKKSLGAQWLEVDRETVGLNRKAEIWIDVAEFGELLAKYEAAEAKDAADITNLHKAVELYRGDFLAGFTLADSAAFDEWQSVQSEYLLRKLVDALEKLVCHHRDLGEFASAIGFARRWLMLDPLHEQVHCHLMQLYDLSGDHAAALRQYEECVRLLRQELGVAPAEATIELYQAIRRHPTQVSGDKITLARKTDLSHNLPLQPTRFVGRKTELEQVAVRLADPECRLLSVVGPGGIGKSRLALEAAAGQVGNFAQGICFVPLASVDKGELLAAAIVDALDVPRQGSAETKTVLFSYLKERQVLLLLDNFEYLLNEVDLVVEILHHAPNIKLLVTSRERLNLREEWLLPLAGMRVPQMSNVPLSVAQVDDYDAVQFSLDCVRHLHPDFSESANLVSLVQICRLVDGIPLAIELAVSWLRVLSLEAIAAEIERRLDLLTTTLRNVPDRHRSMRAVFDHSWALLVDRECIILCQLSIFRGGFTREAAEVVAGASITDLAALVDKSWLRKTSQGRYDMHELVRHYSLEKLAHETEQRSELPDGVLIADVRHRHSAYYALVLEQKAQSLNGRKQGEAFVEMMPEIDNIWAAWHWAVDHGRVELLGQLLDSIGLVAFARGLFHEVVQVLDRAVTHLKAMQESTDNKRVLSSSREVTFVLARVLTYQGWLSSDLGLLHAAAKHCSEAITLLSSVELQPSQERTYGLATLILGWSLYHAGKYEQAASHYHEARAYFDKCSNSWERRVLYLYHGLTSLRLGKYEEAEAFVQEGLIASETAGDLAHISACLRVSAQIAFAQGHSDLAQTLLDKGLQVALELNSHKHICHTYLTLGDVAAALGSHQEARRNYEKGLALAHESGDRLGEVAFFGGLGKVALAQGDHEKARERFHKTLMVSQEIGRTRDAATALIGLGNVACALGEYAQARQHFDQALQTAVEIQAAPDILDALVGMADLFTRLDEVGQATALLEYVLNHTAATRQTRYRAERLLLTLDVDPPTAQDGANGYWMQSLEQIVMDLSLSKFGS